MLKFIFWSLLSINALLFAYGKGYLGNFQSEEREPARMKNQLNADKLTLLVPGGAVAPKPPAAEAEAPVVAAVEAKPAADKAESKPAPLVCVMVGNFGASEARRFEAALAPLKLGARQSREEVGVPEITSHIVYIPPQASKEAADRKAAELKELGVTNYFIMNDSSPMKWGISLGVFKSETAAQTLLAALVKQGVVGAKVTGRPSAATKMAYRFRSLEPAAKAKLDAVIDKFPSQETQACK